MLKSVEGKGFVQKRALILSSLTEAIVEQSTLAYVSICMGVLGLEKLMN